jgi:hypothetical protein
MRVDIYWNLHKGGYSVRHRGLVIMHTDRVALRDARFVVQRGGYEATIREHCKRVHAVVRGELDTGPVAIPEHAQRVRYNPYRCDYFHNESGGRVDAAAMVRFSVVNGKPVVEAIPEA